VVERVGDDGADSDEGGGAYDGEEGSEEEVPAETGSMAVLVDPHASQHLGRDRIGAHTGGEALGGVFSFDAP
jgi:hypothetical protein